MTDTNRKEDMPDAKLVRLISQVTRLMHKRSSAPRSVALGDAYRLIARYASEHGHSEEWCDRVLLIFITEKDPNASFAPRAA